MDDFLKIALVLIAVFAAFLAFRFVAVFVAMLRVPCWPVKFSPLISQAGLAPEEQAAVDELAQLGFVQVAAKRIQMGPLSHNGLLFKHRESEHYAFLYFAATTYSAFVPAFYSFTADGRMLETANRIAWAMIGPVS